MLHTDICFAARLLEEVPSGLESPRTLSSRGVANQKLKKKIAAEIAEMRKQGGVTATSDIGVFVSVSTPSASQRARLETLPAGVELAVDDDARSETGKSEVSEFGTAASLLGEAVATSDCPGEFHGLRQNTLSRSTPRPRASGPKGFSNAGLLANITSAPTRPNSTDSAPLPSVRARTGVESILNNRRGAAAPTASRPLTSRSDLESIREQAPVTGNNIIDALQPSALPQPSSGASGGLKGKFSSFTPPPSAQGSVYNSQRSATNRQDAPLSTRSSVYNSQRSATDRHDDEPSDERGSAHDHDALQVEEKARLYPSVLPASAKSINKAQRSASDKHPDVVSDEAYSAYDRVPRGDTTSLMQNSLPRPKDSRFDTQRSNVADLVPSALPGAEPESPTRYSGLGSKRDKISDVLQPSALPKSSSAASGSLKGKFSSFTPPPSDRGSVYSSQRSARDDHDAPAASVRGSIHHSQGSLSRPVTLPSSVMLQQRDTAAAQLLGSVRASAEHTSQFKQPLGPAKSELAIASEHATTTKAKEEIDARAPPAFMSLKQKIAAEIASRRAAERAATTMIVSPPPKVKESEEEAKRYGGRGPNPPSG